MDARAEFCDFLATRRAGITPEQRSQGQDAGDRLKAALRGSR